MKKFETEFITEEIASLGFDKLKKFSLTYERKIESVKCCKNKVFTEGCLFSIPSIIDIKICNNCLFDLYEVLFRSNSKFKNDLLCKLRIFDYEFIISKAEMKLILNKIEQYICYLYTEHLAYYIFNNMSPIKENLVNSFKVSIDLSNDELEYYNSLTNGQKKEYLFLKTLPKIKNGNKKKIFSYKDKTTTIKNQDFQVFCMVREMLCKSSFHKEERKAVLVLVNKSINGFAFSFCSDCLYNFGLTLFKIYCNPNLTEYHRESFKVEHITIDAPCLISGVNQKKMYRVSVYNSVFVLNKKYFNSLTETILTSAAFRELFSEEYTKFNRIIFAKQVNEDKTIRKQMIKEQKRAELEAQNYREMQKQLQNNYEIERNKFTVELSELKWQVDTLRKENKKQREINNSYVREKLRYKELEEKKEIELAERKIRQKEYFEKRILNCVSPRQSVLNLKVPKMNDKSLKYKGLLKATPYDELPCKTLNHIVDVPSKVIIETYQKDDQLCLSICNDCIRIIRDALKSVTPNNTYYFNKKRNLEIRYLRNFSGSACHSCGTKKDDCYYIRFGNVTFHLCEQCKLYWIIQLSKMLIL